LNKEAETNPFTFTLVTVGCLVFTVRSYVFAGTAISWWKFTYRQSHQ